MSLPPQEKGPTAAHGQSLVIITFNLEGYKRNRFYLKDLIKQEHPRLIFLQELWISHYEGQLLCQDFPNYQFHVTTPDIFDNSEELILSPSHTWHGAATAWHNSLQSFVTPPCCYS